MEYTELKENLNNLKDIQTQMEDLAFQAKELVRHLKSDDQTSLIGERAYAYWLPHIMMEVTEEHEWMGNSMCGMYDTVRELEELLEESDDPDDEPNDEILAQQELEDFEGLEPEGSGASEVL
jgi:hypothetical protein